MVLIYTEMNLTGSGFCPVAGHGINSVETLGSATGVLVACG
jgi:hypothetical protein